MRSKCKKIIKSNKKTIIILMIFVIALCFLGFISFIVLTPKLYLTGKNISLEIGSKYTEPGYKSYVLNKDISNRVNSKNNINTNKIGTYKVEYEVKYLIFDVKKERTINIVDKKAPIITLKGDNKITLCPNNEYKESGYEAYDNYDGNLTSKVERIVKKNKIIYRVKDTFGNLTVKERILEKSDNESPVITLNGYNYITLYRGTKYIEPGYKAIDNCDGDISSKVETSGQINVDQIGIYTKKYKVTDTSGNTTIVSRTINVVNKLDSTKGVIYLTFDDGPSSTITNKILDILKEENIKATFFVINHDNSLNYLIKREYDEGHTVGLHSYTHNYATIYANNNAYLEDLTKINDKVKNIVGSYSKIIRFPGGSSNTISRKYTKGVMTYLSQEVTKKGYKYFDWNVSSEDAGGVHSSGEVYNNVINNLSPTRANIVLMHDFENNYYTLGALKNIIEYAKNQGYTFSKITLETPQITHRINN